MGRKDESGIPDLPSLGKMLLKPVFQVSFIFRVYDLLYVESELRKGHGRRLMDKLWLRGKLMTVRLGDSLRSCNVIWYCNDFRFDSSQ